MSLKTYLKKAYIEVHLTWEAVLSSIEHLEVTLQHDRENLILVYGGSFNPPHSGHIDVLHSGLRPEVGAQAIIILPCEDYLLRNKMVNDRSNFFLHMQRRAEIWSAIPSIPKDRILVWNNNYFAFKAMVEALIRLTEVDGFKVAFSHMIGPDNLRLHDPLMVLPYIYPRILVTNKARHLQTHFMPDGTPVMWDGFGEWSHLRHIHSSGQHISHMKRLVIENTLINIPFQYFLGRVIRPMLCCGFARGRQMTANLRRGAIIFNFRSPVLRTSTPLA